MIFEGWQSHPQKWFIIECMLKIFYGDDRVRMLGEARAVLGEGCEVVEGEDLAVNDMVNVFEGASLFSENRKILVKGLGENKSAWGELMKYLGTENEVVLVESKLDKRGVMYKELVAKKVEMREFKAVEAPEKKLVFDVLDTAMRGEGRKAVEMVEKIEMNQDAYMFFGLMVSQAVKKLEMGNRKARRVIAELAKADLEMKSLGLEAWLIVKKVLVKIALS